jgi:glycosyltransferase involved in cell wall biosynthesis
MARYEWIALLDADDVFLPTKMQKQLAAAQSNPDVVLWGSYAYNIGEQGTICDVAQDGPPSIAAFEKLRRSGSVIMLKNSSTLFRKEFALKLGGFDSQYDSTEDTELWNRMAEHGPIVVIPEPLILYRFHPQSLSVKKMAFQYACVAFIRARNRKRLVGQDLELSEFLKAYESRNPVVKWIDRCTMLSNTYWRNAGIMISNGNRSKGMYWLMRSWIANPFMITWRVARKIGIRLTTRNVPAV